MRLQLVALVLLAAPAWADERPPASASGALEVYTDSDDTTVVTAVGQHRRALGKHVEVDATATIDVISSASVDVISAATPRFNGARGELAAGVTFKGALTESRVAAVVSGERDWLSGSVQLGWTRFLAKGNASVRAGYGLTYNSIGDARGDHRDFSGTMVAHTGELGYTQLLGPRTRLLVAHTLQWSTGYHASPYRQVHFASGEVLDEAHPDSRLRLALSGSIVRYLGGDTSLSAGYRAYGDSWGVFSHTATLLLAHDRRNGGLTLALRARGYYQSAADFYQDAYGSPVGRDHFSFEKELATLWNLGGGPGVTWRPNQRWTLGVHADATHYRYLDFSELTRRTSFVGGVTVSRTW